MTNFSSESSIHGVKYAFGKGNSTLTRVIWSIALIVAFVGLSFYIYSAFVKWEIEPETVLRATQRSMREIPFPAITICNEVIAKRSFLNYRFENGSFYFVRSGELEMTERDCKYLHANIHWCLNPPYPLIDHVCPIKVDGSDAIDAIELMNESSLSADEFVDTFERFPNNFASGLTEPVPSNRIYDKVLTDRGFCYTTNMQNHDVIFNDVISSDFDSYKRVIVKQVLQGFLGYKDMVLYNDTRQWTVEKGYPTDEDITFPARAVKINHGQAPLRVNKTDLSNFCYSKQSHVFFHLPNEVLTLFHKVYPIDQSRFVEFHISAENFQTDEALRGYPPQVRDCYFEGERQLKFFKTYTKNLCYWECMTNYTLKLCGCVKFSMPRDNHTKVCGLYSSKCFVDAMETWPNQTKADTKPCDCLPTCHDIKYKISVVNNSPMDAKMTDMYLNFLAFRVHGYVAEVQQTMLSYKLQNFITDCGGLFGLFLGCSLLSIIEIVYFCIKSCFSVRNRHLTHKIKIVKPANDISTKNFGQSIESN